MISQTLALDAPTAILAYVVAPLIAAAGSLAVVVVQIRRARKENRDDHDRNLQAIHAIQGAVEAVHGEVKAVGDRLDDHIYDHRRSDRVT